MMASEKHSRVSIVKKWLIRISIGRSPKRTLIRAAILAAIAFIVCRFFLLPVQLCGNSMEPTYRNGSFNFVNTFAFRFRTPARGDIVAIRMAGRHILLFKRVIGLPGERVAFLKGVLQINGNDIAEPYIQRNGTWKMAEVTIAENEYFVADDNRATPIRTHALGRIQKHKILGGPLF